MTYLDLAVLDCTNLPIVTLDKSKLESQGIEAMISDFEVLLRAGHTFVLSMARGRGTDQSHDDQKRWVLWLKENRDRMAASCRGVVSVVDAASDPALQKKQVAGMQAMLGIPVKLATNAEEADRIAAELLH